MGRFVSPLSLDLLSESPRRWRVREPLVYESGELPRITGRAARFKRPGRIVVPPGFETDLASVPRLPLAWLAAGDTALAPACLHDWLYTAQPFPRESADNLLLEAMDAAGIPWWRRRLMYGAVRAFGARPWEQNKGRREDALKLLQKFIRDSA